MVTAPDINTCVVWKDNAMAFGPCAGEGENVSFAVLCSDKPGTAADNKVCAFFLGEPTEKKCVAPDGDKVKLATDCDSANMQASQLWEVRPVPAKPAA